MAPIVGRSGSLRSGRDGAIAQLGERVVRNDEVGGSIPPGSTSLRSLRELRLGMPHPALSWRRERMLPRHSPKGDGGLGQDPIVAPPPHFPVNRGALFSTKLATPSRKSLPFSAICISRLASMVASASVWNGTS